MAAGIDLADEAPTDPGFLVLAGAADLAGSLDTFIQAVARHKHYEREEDPSPV
jgi:hypothetical protein